MSYQPQTLQVICQAFDQAWDSIVGSVKPDDVEATRIQLANAVLSVTAEESQDADVLAARALRVLKGELWSLRWRVLAQRPAPFASELPQTLQPYTDPAASELISERRLSVSHCLERDGGCLQPAAFLVARYSRRIWLGGREPMRAISLDECTVAGMLV
jgi:hypothetical protein